ncbi:PREDICTED: GMP synthase [glutamine-hydrolyzing] isoform X2 [Theobroma cacao]|uniref:GMP synthase [glutamine-hydrolyzing] n=1 Tax=Theobroma cacao TaxID=3641 RepID=A0AB32W0X2_THECC|nr:PREDICTED: GMP synthase [glutamine-hydrolyzing] isoform X2 [Theobroma cacao]
MDPKAVKSDLVLILDFGSQYTHLITRRIRSLSIFSLCISGTSPLSSITSLNPKVVILSGGPHSVHSDDSPSFADGFVKWALSNGVFVLGICYGLQLLVQRLGGEVRVGERQEYGRMEIEVEKSCGLFGGKRVGDRQVVWMSHGDEAARLPNGFQVVARSQQGAVAAVEDQENRFYGLQYHPEVTHSPEGMETLRNFLFDVCGMNADWKMEDVMDEEIKVINNTVGPDDHVICALSGGVDSTVAAMLVHRAIGDRLHCVFVDNGLLRYKERERVMETFERDLHLPVTCVDATNQFLRTGRTHSHTIKSHHNVGGLPKDMKLKLIEPLKLLFKDEVRQLGGILRVPELFLKRHPFPGPGLAVRILGDVTEGNALDILRQVDEIFIQSIKDAGIYDSIWQAFAVFLPVKSVGVQGDQRTHSHVVALRAVTSQDGMTADWYYFEHEFLDDVARKICNNVRGVNRVVQDITSKPPSTIEWE